MAHTAPQFLQSSQPTDATAPIPRARRWRLASRRVRAAVWRLQAPDELGDLLEEIHRTIQDLEMPVYGCGVNIVDVSSEPPTVMIHSLSDGRRARISQMAAGVVLGFWRGGEPVLRDLDGDDPHDEKRDFPFLKTIVDVPFSHGTLAVNSKERHAFNEGHLARLQDLADMLGDGFRRLDELRWLEVRQLVREQVWRMRSPDDIVPVMSAMREGLQRLGLRFTHCGLNLVQPDQRDTLVHSMEPDSPWAVLTDKRADPLLHRMWREQRVVYRRDLTREDPFGEAEAIFAHYGTRVRCVIDVPFSHGTLALNHTEPEAFSQAQVAMLQDLAGLLEDGFRRVDDLRRLEARNVELERALGEKDVLLKEIHHRVKNNLQVVSSLLNLRAASIEDPDALRSFEDSVAQIQSMALIHEHLYDSQDLTRLDCAEYVQALASTVFSSYGIDPGRIGLQVEVEPHSVSVDTAIHCGLILHELVSNALKYAFPDGRTGTVRIDAGPWPGTGRGRLRVRDDGVGLPADLDPQQSRSLGLRLVGDLARQMGGSIDIDRGQGAAFEFTYPLLPAADPAVAGPTADETRPDGG